MRLPTKQTRRIELLPKQFDFVSDTRHRALLYSGAFGAGKTRALCIRHAMRASIPGAREILCRKHLVTLKRTTLRCLLEPTGNMPPVLPYGSYTHHKGDNIIRIHGGGEISYFGLDDPQKTGSTDATGIGIDEGVELNEQDWIWLRGRVRVKVKGLSNCIDTACNPGAPSHFLAQMFGAVKGAKAERGHRLIQTSTLDNWFLPDDYVTDLKRMKGLAYRRYVLGEWAGSEGLVYSSFDRQAMVRPLCREEMTGKTVVCVDVGFSNPTAIVVLNGDEDRVRIPYEWYKRQQRKESIIAATWNAVTDWNADVVVVDPSAAELIHSMVGAGLPVHPVRNRDVFEGILNVQKFVQVDDDGDTRILVDPSCENVIREFESYEWATRPGSGKSEYVDKPVKTNDHAMDAIRYGIQEVVAPSAAGVW